MTFSIVRASSDDASGMAVVQVEGLRIAYAGLVPSELLDPTDVGGRARHWRAWLRRQRAHTSVARIDGTVAGFVAAHPAPVRDESEGSIEIAAFFVAPDHWGQGIGTALLQHVLSATGEEGGRGTVVWVLESNERAKRFYSGRGFALDGGTRVFAERSDGPVLELRYRYG